MERQIDMMIYVRRIGYVIANSVALFPSKSAGCPLTKGDVNVVVIRQLRVGFGKKAPIRGNICAFFAKLENSGQSETVWADSG